MEKIRYRKWLSACQLRNQPAEKSKYFSVIFLPYEKKQRTALHTAALKRTGKDGRVRQSVDLL